MRVNVEMWVAKASRRELLALDPSTLTIRVLPYSVSTAELQDLADACAECLDRVANLQTLRVAAGPTQEGASA